jgi:uncharacterized protein (TIGR01777 family)
MHILITGGTGLIGRSLCQHWLEQGHHLTVWSRRPQQVSTCCGKSVRAIAQLTELDEQRLDAVINLAGAGIADRPWSKARRAILWSSRIGLSEQLLDWLQTRQQRPALLLSGSATGWYGDAGERPLDENAAPGADFAARLCQAWEDSAQRAELLGIRVILLRTGLVLSREGGMLKRMLLPYRLGLGGPMGDGRQWMPWIHWQDQIRLIDFLLHDQQARGAYNACAPQPVRNKQFARALGHALGRPAILPLPAFILRSGLGEMATLLLTGQHAQPHRLLQAGFKFRFSQLDAALQDLLGER